MKKIIIPLLVLLIVVVFYNTPDMIASAIPSAYYITPDKKTYENVVNCTGTIQSANIREIYLQSAVVPSTVCVEVGDFVNEGNTLALIDREMTEKLNTSASDLIRGISGGIESDAKSSNIDWLSLASDYGLSAVLNGGDIDYGKLHNAIQGSTETSLSASGLIVEGLGEKIESPVSGVVTEVNLKPDAPVTSGKPVLTIMDVNSFKVQVAVNESDISKISVGDSAKIRGVGFSGSTYIGEVSKIYPTARKSLTGAETVVDVEITLNASDDRIKPGFSAKVEITGGNNYDLITVPYEAIRQDENNNEYVYMYENGKLKKQVVITGQELTNEVEIMDGLTPDSVVVYNPNGLIKEGSMISLKGRAGA